MESGLVLSGRFLCLSEGRRECLFLIVFSLCYLVSEGKVKAVCWLVFLILWSSATLSPPGFLLWRIMVGFSFAVEIKIQDRLKNHSYGTFLFRIPPLGVFCLSLSN